MYTKAVEEKLSIMTELLIIILNYDYSEAYDIIVKSQTYKWLKDLDYATMYDSPQANLSSIGEELRASNNPLGTKITDENIKKAMISKMDIKKEVIE